MYETVIRCQWTTTELLNRFKRLSSERGRLGTASLNDLVQERGKLTRNARGSGQIAASVARLCEWDELRWKPHDVIGNCSITEAVIT